MIENYNGKALHLTTFLHQQKINGRNRVSEEFKSLASFYNYWANSELNRENLQHKKENLEFLKIITETLTRSTSDPIPKYDSYIEIKVLEWYLEGRISNIDSLNEFILRGIYNLAYCFLIFEKKTLAKEEKYYGASADNIDLEKRVSLLEKFLNKVNNISNVIIDKEFQPLKSSPKTLLEYVSEKDRIAGLVDFSCFPQTNYHDEYTFIRTIQISEFCFIALNNIVKRIVNNINLQEFGKVEILTKNAILYIDLLYNIFRVLRTMPAKPKNNFADFRNHTGNASAIQSKTYQELEVLLYGIRKNKRQVYENMKELDFINKNLKYYEENNIAHLIREGKLDDNTEVFQLLKKMDNKFIKWKALHLGFALTYLPEHTTGTGKTEGAPYLKAIYKNSIFA